MPTPQFISASNALVASLTKIDMELTLDKRTNPEDQLKVPISTFLTEIGKGRTRQVNVVTEHRQLHGDQVQDVRLDMAIKDGRGLLTGHIELKAPGKSANPYRKTGWSSHDKKQWKRLENHANLIYSNGWEWTLLRHGAGKPLAHIILSPDAEGQLSDNQIQEFFDLLDQFLSWKPISPSTPKSLADQLAPLARLLRDSVVEVITDNTADALDNLYAKWKQDLMPGATEKQFADSFAQTFTYALLLARVESDVPAEEFNASAVTPELRHNGHRLIGSVLEIMSQERNRGLVESPVSLLEAVIGAVDVDKFTTQNDPWLYFYEDFLSSYDPKMRADAGVFYTPVEIVEAQVRLLDYILKSRYGCAEGLGDSTTHVLDNATGSGAYPLAVARHVIENSPSPRDAARSLADRLYAFELLMGPYSVAHMRLTQMLESTGIELGHKGVQVYLTNSLTDPGDVSDEEQQMYIWEVEAEISEETRKAGLVKNSQTPIRVILGNPPYDRGSRQKALGAGSKTHRNVILEQHHGKPALLQDFIEPLTRLGLGGQAKNLYNSYVYFIRWAIWKACEQHKDESGIVSYITSSSYLRGPGFAGMREYMRRVFDELWIVDLGGEGRGARKEENVFAIQTPVAIFFGIQNPRTRTGSKKKHSDRIDQKAKVHYLRVSGSRTEKLEAISKLQAPDGNSDWQVLPQPKNDWGAKFVPSTAAALSDGVPLSSIFPWSHSGAQFKRKWPIAPHSQTLSKRWSVLVGQSTEEKRATYFRETSQKHLHSPGQHLLTLSPLRSLHDDIEMLSPIRYGYRSFDRQYALPDSRLNDRPRPQLWEAYSNFQLYIATLTSTSLGEGPAVTVSPYVPDMDFFKNRGAKDIHPLYRTQSTQHPNVSAALFNTLRTTYKTGISAFDVAAYVVGLLGTGAYTERFAEELAESVAHVPFTANAALFNRVAKFGRDIIFNQTWGERGGKLNAFGQAVGERYKGRSKIAVPTPHDEYPETWSYNPDTQELSVGNARFCNVTPEVIAYNVSGMNVIASWLGYRMKNPSGKSSSPLDQIQADIWHHDGELVELLWQLEYMVSIEPTGAKLLDEVIAGPLIPPESLGQPTSAETKPPAKRKLGMEEL